MTLKFSHKEFTLFAIFACVLGVNFSLQIAGIQLSLYRLVLIVTPLFFLLPSYNKIIADKSKKGMLYVQFLSVWLVYSFLTIAWVEDYMSWIKYTIFLVSGWMMTILIFANINTEETFLKAIKVVVFLSMALSVLAFYESVTGNYFFLSAEDLEWYQDVSLLHKVSIFREPITVFGNPNNYALFLFFSFAFTFLLMVRAQKRLHKLFYAIFLAVTVFLIIITFSRSALFGVFLFIGSILLIALLKGSYKVKKSAMILLACVAMILIQLLIKYYFFVEGILLLEFGGEGTSDSIRTNLILNGFQILKSTFLLGTGIGNVEHQMSSNMIHNTGEIVNLHNWWMEILISSGILIFVFYIYVYFKTLLRLWINTNYKKDKRFFWIKGVFASIFVGFIIACVGPSSLMVCEWLWPLMALSHKAFYIIE